MTASPVAASRPWTPGALRLTLAANVVAAVVLFIAWYGAAGEAQLHDATTWANLSAIGLLVAAFGNVRLLLVARARIGSRQAALRRSRLAARSGDTGDHRRVVLPGGRLYHRASCRLVAGKPAEALPRLRPAGVEPCGWCRP
jgi:hypothetical protein